ncbi:hypothetical protein EOD39_8463 [Acipenser ruthenus]|uniref:Uncharacterized protein n=1 Tax=Acipenser ruthenus TaxID=7906 RepID=A0A662YXT9_ACIRT|nr:hypothetical protein EOD39_8463 [Acipenser ruthenus]
MSGQGKEAGRSVETAGGEVAYSGAVALTERENTQSAAGEPPSQSSQPEVKYKGKETQLTDTDIIIGSEGRAYLLENGGDIPTATLTRIFETVRKFYEAAIEKMIKSFPLNNQRRPEEGALTLYWLLEEPLIHNPRLDTEATHSPTVTRLLTS